MSSTKRGAPGEGTPLTGGGLLAGETIPTIQQSPPRTQALNWRDHLDVHPAAEMFPLLSETDPAALKELAEDIRQHGQREPASYIKDSDGNRVLLDGRNRLDALEMLGRKIDINDSSMFEQRSLSIDAQAFIISKNIHRRHLNAEDKRDLIAKLLKAKPETSNRQVAKMVDASHPHVAKVRKALEESGDVETVTTSIDTKGRKQPAKKQIQPEKSTSSDSSRSGVSQVSTAPEKLTSGLPTGSDSSKNPVQQAEIAEPQTQPNPIVRAWIAATREERRQFAKEWGDDIVGCVRVNRSESDPLRFQLWDCCVMIELYLEDNKDSDWAEEYQDLADQLLALEQQMDDAEAEDEEEDADPDDGLNIPAYLKRAAP